MSLQSTHNQKARHAHGLGPSTYKPKVFKQVFAAGFLGNLLDHYDTALYGLLVPWLAPLIFPKEDPVVALIIAYGLLSAGIFTRPLGALFFGKYALKHGAKKTLIVSLLGVAFATMSMGFLPLYKHVAYKAVAILAALRALQAFFAAGETAIAPLFILQQDKPSRYTLTSSFYEISSMLGIFLASGLVWIGSQQQWIAYGWRYLFGLGFLTALVALVLRLSIQGEQEPQIPKNTKLYPIIKNNKGLLLQLFCVSSLNYLTYMVPFVFLNSFVPLISSISKEEILRYNTLLLVLDMLLLPLVGYIAKRYQPKAFMLGAAILLSISLIPIFLYMQKMSLGGLTLARIWMISLGLGFMVPKQAWMMQSLKPEERYVLKSFAYHLAAETLGRSSPAICLALWYKTASPLGPAVYITAIALAGVLALLSSKRGPALCKS